MTTSLPLKTTEGSHFKINYPFLEPSKKELEAFLKDKEYLNNRTFSKKVMFTHELKANNTIEGIHDSMAIIEKVIEDAKQVTDVERRNRIINLYRGYRYILDGKDINEKTLLRLYKILSKDLLDNYDLTHMGPKYRNAPVYILDKGRLDDTLDTGIPEDRIESLMDSYFDYINNGETFNDQTDYFIKSQIMHFYFVYIHPFFDINGRTSRTTSMWYLLNNNIYPYIIFNRGISMTPEYDKIIKECKNYRELSLFIEFMMSTVKKELEKEHIMHILTQSTNRKWEAVDYQTIEYFLSLNGTKSVLDFLTLYNRFNDPKKAKEVFEKMLIPLIDDGTLEIERSTSKTMYGNEKNLVLRLSSSRLNDINKNEITKINL